MADIDGLIAQGVKPPVVEDPMTVYGRLQAIRAQRQQMQMNAQQMQGNALTLQKNQREIDDEKKYRDILIANSVAQNSPAAEAQAQAPQGGAAQLASVASGSGDAEPPAPDDNTPQLPRGVPASPPPGVPVQTAPGTNQPLHTFNVDKTVKDLRAIGLHNQADGIMTNYLKQQLDAASYNKDQAQAAEANQNAESKKQERINQAHMAAAKYLIDLPDEAAREKAFPYAMQNLVAAGAAHPENANITYQQYGGMDALKRDYATSTTAQQRIEDDNAKRAQGLYPSQLAEATTKAAEAALSLKIQVTQNDARMLAAAAESGNPKAVEQLKAGLPADRLIPFVNATTAAQFRAIGSTPAEAATQAQTAAHNKVEEGQGAQRIAIEQQNSQTQRVAADPYGMLGLNKNPAVAPDPNAHGDEFLKTLPPLVGNQVRAIAEGRQTQIQRSQVGQLMPLVEQYDPTYTADRAKVRAEFTGGSGPGKNIMSMNTAVVHLGQLKDVGDAMGNKSFTPANQLYNSTIAMFGGATPTNFEGLKAAVAGEMATALKGSATDQEINHINDAIKSKNSPQQLAGYISEQMRVLGAKLNTADETYHAKLPSDPWSPIGQAAGEVFRRNGINPINRTTPASTAPIPLKDGTVLTPHDAAAAAKFRADHADLIK